MIVLTYLYNMKIKSIKQLSSGGPLGPLYSLTLENNSHKVEYGESIYEIYFADKIPFEAFSIMSLNDLSEALVGQDYYEFA